VPYETCTKGITVEPTSISGKQLVLDLDDDLDPDFALDPDLGNDLELDLGKFILQIKDL